MPDAASIPAALPLAASPAVSPAPANDPTASGIVLLTRRLATGDEAAFREFHALYFDRLYHFLLVVTRGQEHAAQDALQETLLRVVRHAREFDREDVFWGWLKAIARNAARDGGRRQRRYLALLHSAFGRNGQAPSIDETADDDRVRAWIEEALAELEPADRRLIEGKYLRGATVCELAAESGATEKAVESRLGRLRRLLGDTLRQKLRAP